MELVQTGRKQCSRTAVKARQDYSTFFLKPSLIPGAGIGCFTGKPITRGTQINSAEKECFRKLAREEVPKEYLHFCILLKDGKYLSPQNFLNMGIFWYVNHSREPNLAFDGPRLISIKDIDADEELTLYYSDLVTHPKNLSWVKQSDI